MKVVEVLISEAAVDASLQWGSLHSPGPSPAAACREHSVVFGLCKSESGHRKISFLYGCGSSGRRIVDVLMVFPLRRCYCRKQRFRRSGGIRR